VIWGELKNGSNWAQTHWAAIQAARENRDKISKSLILVCLYNEARTFFQENF